MDTLFSLNHVGVQVVAMLATFLLCLTLGAERHLRHKDAGVKTHVLVGLGSCLFTLVSAYGFAPITGSDVAVDPSRVAAQIVSGIGFLGAGVIFVNNDTVRGLTTAATVWLSAAIGMACGAGMIPLAATAVAIRIDSPGPVFYTQTRVGQNGKPFTMWKFRSMYTDSDARRASVVKSGGDAGNEVMFKDRQDPRITHVGRWIRRLSIDELPQLINVVRGDMSLVGPRPALPVEVAKYDAEALRRLLVKPGLTGLWQISGRSDLSWASTVALDRHYVENRGGALDAKIFAGTLRAVIGGKGAY